ncbi:MAG: hypothetical protein QOC65_1045 [Sphingomonadales bacterium]|nr:hypothetical protein [Sphingomonadales bacterium]
MSKTFALLALLALPAVPASALTQSAAAVAPSDGAEAAVAAFVAGLNSFDRGRFEALFAEDATLFFPAAPFPVRRIEGRAAIGEWFGRFFDSARRRGATRGNVTPRDLRVQSYGNVAVATFHLEGGDNVGRRTLVLRRQARRWLVIHLHASSLPLPAPAERR